jgi:hypothetical protein
VAFGLFSRLGDFAYMHWASSSLKLPAVRDHTLRYFALMLRYFECNRRWPFNLSGVTWNVSR